MKFQTLLRRYGESAHERVAHAEEFPPESLTTLEAMTDAEAKAKAEAIIETLQMETILALHQQSVPEAAGQVFPSLPPEALYLHSCLTLAKNEPQSLS